MITLKSSVKTQLHQEGM